MSGGSRCNGSVTDYPQVSREPARLLDLALADGTCPAAAAVTTIHRWARYAVRAKDLARPATDLAPQPTFRRPWRRGMTALRPAAHGGLSARAASKQAGPPFSAASWAAPPYPPAAPRAAEENQLERCPHPARSVGGRPLTLLMPTLTNSKLLALTRATAMTPYRRALVEEDVRVDVERHALTRVSELRQELRHRHAASDLHRRVAAPKVMRVIVRDPGRLAGTPHRALRHVRPEAGKHAPLRRAALPRHVAPSSATTVRVEIDRRRREEMRPTLAATDKAAEGAEPEPRTVSVPSSRR
jgi:hypothetical protein